MRKHFRILISCLCVALCVYLGNIAYNQTFKKNVLNVGQNLIDGEQKKVVFNKHLELLISGHPLPVLEEKEIFNSSLSKEEIFRINKCQIKAQDDFLRESFAFEQNKHICVRHHSYLKENGSILIEIGGNFGSDASLFTALYNPRHIIVEPLEYYANILKAKFKDNSRVTVLNFGLGKETGLAFMKMIGEASNINSNTANTMVDVINSTDFFQNLGVGLFRVDLLTMDCEGCELDVLENLVESGMVKYFKNIQFEQHGMTDFVNHDDYLRRYCTLQEYMNRTHRATFQYKHVWENWRLNGLK